ncbi:MAG: isoprenylcysteine carboxylmethyltransferase family protein [Scytolyngbya sp. HA4215-MV1]|nr:isoprenylcysteine carboxylmethyltransferase family protein [Scytolyngbya sp. HA4215-MV1]
MKILSSWGFTSDGWRGQKGEYWVLIQVLLIIGFFGLPSYRPAGFNIAAPTLYGVWGIAGIGGLSGIALLLRGLQDLGHNLTTLPYPKEDGQLVSSGSYRIVRHPLYSGLIFVTLSWAIYQLSLSHLLGVGIIFVFLNAKSTREESWLTQKYAEYTEYQQNTKKLIPGLY